jgi:SAM-dependent methyltransferase
MPDADDTNLVLAASPASVDALNAEFYGRFPYPWRPARFEYLLDPHFETVMLNQDLGDWQHRRVPEAPSIWVAGCGTNQALITALRFPAARVFGSDLSVSSLDLCARTARELRVSNLELKEESLNEAAHDGRFDYVVCTGVIHHNADPAAVLRRLARALKPAGILELMVYNRFHRMVNAAFQKAVRVLVGDQGKPDFEMELDTAARLVADFPAENLVSRFLSDYRGSSEEAIADQFIQPVESSYTVESLEELASGCGLEMVAPCLNIFDRATKRISWNLSFRDPELRRRYELLSDSRRWQIANLLLFEQSPMLWFYFQRKDSGRPAGTERSFCEGFLESRFVRNETTRRSFVMDEGGSYRLTPEASPYPAASSDPAIREILDAVDGGTGMSEIWARLGLSTEFEFVNAMRLKLTTSAFPYLRSVESSAARPDGPEQGPAVERLKEASREKFRSAARRPARGRGPAE